MNVDLQLQYSRNCEQIKDTLINDIEKIDRDGGILDMEPFPSPRTLALLAKAVYSDGDVILPEGWKLLITASNMSMGNGYVGAAYLNPSLQQVVVSHRGTFPTNIGALLRNIMGFVNTIYTSQMNSAVTFADKIMSVLCEVNEEKGAGLQLSVTGHTLGGWLGQVTAFTLQNVRRVGDSFTMIHDRPPVRHVHTVTFDTPGCRDILGKIIENGYCRYEKIVSPNELDITNYLAPPNRINTTGPHVGTIHLVKLDVSNLGILDKHTSYYNVAIHAIDNFVKAFDSEPATESTREVLDWPVSRSARGGQEYEAFHAMVSHETNYGYTASEQQQKTWMKELRYKTEKVENSCNMRVFCERESYLLELWRALKTENVMMTEISAFVMELGLSTVDDLIADFDIKNHTVTCQDKESLRAVVRRTKQLTRWFPELLGALERQGARQLRAGPLLYRMASNDYFTSLLDCRMCFEDTIGLKVFLESDETRILHVTTEDGRFQVSVICKLLSQMREMSQLDCMNAYLQRDHQTFIDWKKMQHLENIVNFQNLYKSGYTYDDLLVVNLPVHSQNTRLFKRFLDNVDKKLIIISSQQSLNFVRSLDVPFSTAHCEQLKFDDLTEDSKKELFSRKMLVSGGKRFALAYYTGIQHVGELLSHMTNYTDNFEIEKIMTDPNYTIQIEDALLSSDDLKVQSTINEEVNVPKLARVLRKHSDLLVIGGLGRWKLAEDEWKELVKSVGKKRIFTTEGDGESLFQHMCREKPDSIVYWLAVSDGHVSCKTIYNNAFYINRRFHKIIFNFIKFACQENFEIHIQKAKLIILNIDKHSLISRYIICKENKNIILKSDYIITATSDKEADNIKINRTIPIHVLKQEVDGGPILWKRSRGSLEGLLPYVTTDIGGSIDERNFNDTNQKVIIIADEPGSGKSTTLTSLSRLLRSAWVVRVDLNDFNLENLPDDLSLNSVCKFILKDQNNWKHGLLEFCLNKEHEHSREIHIFFDNFDKIKLSSVEAEVLNLLNYLKNETTARVWVATQPHRRKILENFLSAFAMKFERISESDQLIFLVEFWRSHLLLEMDTQAKEKNLNECAKRVFEKAEKMLGDYDQHLMGIPLQMRMLADVCLPRVIDSKIDIENIFDIKSVLDLYQRFINLRFDNYFREKKELNEHDKLTEKDKLIEKFRKLGLRTLFPIDENIEHVPEDGWGAELCRVGLVQAGGGGWGGVEFTHGSFAEHYCADLVVHWLRERGQYLSQTPIEELLLTKILLHDTHRVMRKIIDSYPKLSKEADKITALKISKLWREKQGCLFNRDIKTALHVAVEEGRTGIIDIVMKYFIRAPGQLIPFVAAHDRNRYTALGRAARNAQFGFKVSASTEIMKTIVNSLQGLAYDVQLELLLATYIRYASVTENEINVLSEYIEESDHLELKDVFNDIKEMIKKDIPPFLAAVRAGEVNDVKTLYEKMKNNHVKRYVLLASDGGRETALHLAARCKSNEGRNGIEITEILCPIGNIYPEVGRSYDWLSRTPLHRAAEAGLLDVVKHLIDRKVPIDSLTSLYGETALFYAAREGKLDVIKYLIEEGSDIKILNKHDENALFYAARGDSLDVVKYLIEKEFKLDCINDKGHNILYYARNETVAKFLKTKMS